MDPGDLGVPVTRGRILAWGVWDWGSAAFNAVIVTFVYSVYLTDSVGKDLPGDISANTWLGWSLLERLSIHRFPRTNRPGAYVEAKINLIVNIMRALAGAIAMTAVAWAFFWWRG